MADKARESRWFGSRINGIVYVYRTDSLGTTEALHRWVIDAPEGRMVDHVSGDTFDNRRANLRLATAQQNAQNRRVRSDSLSGAKGVRLAKSGSWYASVTYEGRRVHLGAYDSRETATLAYEAAARALFGEFARTTRPPLDPPGLPEATPATIKRDHRLDARQAAGSALVDGFLRGASRREIAAQINVTPGRVRSLSRRIGLRRACATPVSDQHADAVVRSLPFLALGMAHAKVAVIVGVTPQRIDQASDALSDHGLYPFWGRAA